MTKRYEAMFLFDSSATPDWAAVDAEIKRLMERIGATLLSLNKFDDRKLAYEIKRRKRGTYVLVYFESDTNRIGDLERDARLSDLILRLLVLDGSEVKDERIAELKAMAPEVPMSPLATDSHRHRDDGGRDGGRDRGDRPWRRDRRDRDSEEFAPAGADEGGGAEAARDA